MNYNLDITTQHLSNMPRVQERVDWRINAFITLITQLRAYIVQNYVSIGNGKCNAFIILSHRPWLSKTVDVEIKMDKACTGAVSVYINGKTYTKRINGVYCRVPGPKFKTLVKKMGAYSPLDIRLDFNLNVP